MTYWAIVGGLRYVPGEDYLFMTMESCTFDNEPHSPQREEFKLHSSVVPEFFENMFGGRPVFEMNESLDSKSIPVAFLRFYKELQNKPLPGSVSNNREAFTKFILDAMIRGQDYISRCHYLNPLSDTRYHENYVIGLHDILRKMKYGIKPEWLGSLSKDFYGNVLTNNSDGVLVEMYNGERRRWQQSQLEGSEDLCLGERVRIYSRNPYDDIEFATSLQTTKDAASLAMWKCDIF